MDNIEKEYEMAIRKASNEGDNDKAYNLSRGLSQYVSEYKFQDEPEWKDCDNHQHPEDIL